MYRAVSVLVTLFVILVSGLGMETSIAQKADVTNPVIWADVPDPSVIRVGDNYYMSSTTMHMSPGLPIMKSRDLVNWHLVGYAYATLGENDSLNLLNGKSAYGQGSWASSLHYHEGVFYVSTFSSTTGRTHIFTTRDIEHGPWAAKSFRPALHDHSLFFEDDGRVYLIHGAGNVRLTELEPDLSGIKPGGTDQTIIQNASLAGGSNVGLPAEGSQFYKINGKYYLFMITWPRGGMRTQLVFRSDYLTGPYEGRIALQDQGVAQGSLIDTPKGVWYAFLFQDHGAVGRTPFLVPVTWKDGWPILGVDGKAPTRLSIDGKSQRLLPEVAASDEFTRRPGQAALPLVWQWNHNPDNQLWSITERPGYLRIRTGRLDTDLLSARNTLTQRTFGPQCAGTIAMDVSQMKSGDCAGLGLLQKKYGFVGVKATDKAKQIVMVNADGNTPTEVASIPLTQNVVYLKAECDFRNRADQASFYYSFDGKVWTETGKPMHMVYTLPHFMGYRFALFNFATQTTGGSVDFDYFRVSSDLTAATR